MNKYGNKRVKVDGIQFDSLAELARYRELKLLLAGKQIRSLKVHPAYTLIPSFTDRTGKKQRKTIYEADFSYLEVGSRNRVVEDVKGKRTAVFDLKWKLMLRKYPKLDLRIIEA